MRNDLLRLKFIYASKDGEAETLHTHASGWAVRHLTQAFEVAAAELLDVAIESRITYIDPPRFGSIEVSYAVDFEIVEATRYAFGGGLALGRRLVAASNEGQGLIAALSFLWQMVVGATLWDLIQQGRRGRARRETATLEVEVAEHLLEKRTFTLPVDEAINALEQNRVIRVEMRLRDRAPAVVDEALRRLEDREPYDVYPLRGDYGPNTGGRSRDPDSAGLDIQNEDGSRHEPHVIRHVPANDP